MADYRQVGGRLGAYIRSNDPTTQQIQSLLSDLLAGDDLLSTMRDVVTISSFKALQALAGSGDGAVQRDALLSELARRYLPTVVDEVGQLINGMLDQPAGKTIYRNGSNKLDPPKIEIEDEPKMLHKDVTFIEQNLRYLREPKKPSPRLESLIHKAYLKTGTGNGDSAPEFLRSLREPKKRGLRHGAPPFVLSALAIFIAAAVVWESQNRYANPGANSKNTNGDYRSYNCTIQEETLMRKAKDLPAYYDINNTKIDSNGASMSPWISDGASWQSAYSLLTVHFPPLSISAQQREFIDLVTIYKSQCK